MIFLHGIYRFGQKVVGYRNDFCLFCDKEEVSEWKRSFNCWHLFFIPLIPLGTRLRWACTSCGRDPHARVESSRGFKALVAGFFVLLTIFALVGAIVATLGNAPEFAKPSDAPGIWGGAVVMGLLAAATIFWATRTADPVELADRLHRVPPLTESLCRYCRVPLDGEGKCGQCQAVRYVLEFE